MGQHVIRVALAIVLAVAATFSALLAHGVTAWSAALRGGDVVYAATPSRARWHVSVPLGGAAESLLGVRDDVDLRHALQQYVNAGKLRLRLDNAVEVEGARGRAQDALERVVRTSQGGRASQALTLLGVLAFRASASGSSQSQVDAAISDFSDALRADPGNGDAAFDLELLLRLTTANGTRIEPGQGGGFGRTGRRGAGGSQPGNGY